MICDLCHLSKIKVKLNIGTSYFCANNNCYTVFMDPNEQPQLYLYNATNYTPEEWQRLLRLKAFL